MAFTWGKVIEVFNYDFDGVNVEIIKFHPRVLNSKPSKYEDEIQYHCEELHASFSSIFEFLIAYIAHKKLGFNQHNLVSGICRALNIT